MPAIQWRRLGDERGCPARPAPELLSPGGPSGTSSLPPNPRVRRQAGTGSLQPSSSPQEGLWRGWVYPCWRLPSSPWASLGLRCRHQARSTSELPPEATPSQTGPCLTVLRPWLHLHPENPGTKVPVPKGREARGQSSPRVTHKLRAEPPPAGSFRRGGLPPPRALCE